MKNRYLMVFGLIGSMLLGVNYVMADETHPDTVEQNRDGSVEKHEAWHERRKKGKNLQQNIRP